MYPEQKHYILKNHKWPLSGILLPYFNLFFPMLLIFISIVLLTGDNADNSFLGGFLLVISSAAIILRVARDLFQFATFGNNLGKAKEVLEKKDSRNKITYS